jgi:hypothetical protein
MDVATYTAYAALIVRVITAENTEIGSIAQEYVDAVINRSEGKLDEASLQAVADKFPEPKSTTPEIVSLVSSLIQLSLAFLYHSQAYHLPF